MQTLSSVPQFKIILRVVLILNNIGVKFTPYKTSLSLLFKPFAPKAAMQEPGVRILKTGAAWKK
jgi:hypothetical protein